MGCGTLKMDFRGKKNLFNVYIYIFLSSVEQAVAVNRHREKSLIAARKLCRIYTSLGSLMDFNNHSHINHIQQRSCLIINMFTTILQIKS